jgi:hypothetical protein
MPSVVVSEKDAGQTVDKLLSYFEKVHQVGRGSAAGGCLGWAILIYASQFRN